MEDLKEEFIKVHAANWPNYSPPEIADWWLAQLADQKQRMVDMIDRLEIDTMGNGRDIEIVAERFGVPDSVAAIRILDLKKDDIKSQINNYLTQFDNLN